MEPTLPLSPPLVAKPKSCSSRALINTSCTLDTSLVKNLMSALSRTGWRSSHSSIWPRVQLHGRCAGVILNKNLARRPISLTKSVFFGRRKNDDAFVMRDHASCSKENRGSLSGLRFKSIHRRYNTCFSFPDLIMSLTHTAAALISAAATTTTTRQQQECCWFISIIAFFWLMLVNDAFGSNCHGGNATIFRCWCQNKEWHNKVSTGCRTKAWNSCSLVDAFANAKIWHHVKKISFQKLVAKTG